MTARPCWTPCGQNAFKLGLSTASVLSNNGLRASLQVVGQDKRIENLQTPLAITAADITSGREIVFRRGMLWPAVLASMALPGVYPPQCIGPYTLVDGGVLNPVPSNVAAEMGADTVIAMRLIGPLGPAKDYPESREAAGRVPTMLHTITRSIEMMQSKISFDTRGRGDDPDRSEFRGRGAWRAAALGGRPTLHRIWARRRLKRPCRASSRRCRGSVAERSR